MLFQTTEFYYKCPAKVDLSIPNSKIAENNEKNKDIVLYTHIKYINNNPLVKGIVTRKFFIKHIVAPHRVQYDKNNEMLYRSILTVYGLDLCSLIIPINFYCIDKPLEEMPDKLNQYTLLINMLIHYSEPRPTFRVLEKIVADSTDSIVYPLSDVIDYMKSITHLRGFYNIMVHMISFGLIWALYEFAKAQYSYNLLSVCNRDIPRNYLEYVKSALIMYFNKLNDEYIRKHNFIPITDFDILINFANDLDMMRDRYYTFDAIYNLVFSVYQKMMRKIIEKNNIYVLDYDADLIDKLPTSQIKTRFKLIDLKKAVESGEYIVKARY